jgi:hypothetical protein
MVRKRTVQKFPIRLLRLLLTLICFTSSKELGLELMLLGVGGDADVVVELGFELLVGCILAGGVVLSSSLTGRLAHSLEL